jgi:hypothetical protein
MFLSTIEVSESGFDVHGLCHWRAACVFNVIRLGRRLLDEPKEWEEFLSVHQTATKTSDYVIRV